MSKVIISENSLNKKVIIKEKIKETLVHEKFVQEVNKNIEEVRKNDAKVYVKAKSFIVR